jgi:hypothetical protein
VMRRGLHSRRLVGVPAVVAASVASLAGTAMAAPGGDPGPPPWAPGPGGSDVIHVLHGNDAHPGGSGRSASPLLSYHGGAVQTAPAAYLVFWGSQWSNDPSVEAPVLQKFLGGLYGSADTWSTSTTQYCQSVAVRSTNCSTATAPNMISHPANPPLLDALFDNTVIAPSNPTQSDLAAEAVRAAGLVKAKAGSVNTKAQFVIATAHGYNATGFGSSYCAWHSSTSSPTFGNLAYTNLPYMTDAGASCGAGFVNGTAGALDGVTIVAGHEYAETVTDPFPNSGWLDANGAENGDKCSWISSGQGKASNVTTANGPFPVQSLWSNNYNYNKNIGGCVISYTSPTSQG